MQKYYSIINRRTAYVVSLCIIITYFCTTFDFNFDLNMTMLSIAVVFPLVFTIREAFKRRDNVLKLLSIFKSSLNAVYYCFVINSKLDDDKKQVIYRRLGGLSTLFFGALQGQEYNSADVRGELTGIFDFLDDNRDSISNGVALKIIRFLKDVHESFENTMGIKIHGTPISLRAYCLVFIYLFPFAFIPTLAHDLNGNDSWIIYSLGVMHGFILISLYNVQDALENPFDQVGLDDIKLEEFQFHGSRSLLDEPEPRQT